MNNISTTKDGIAGDLTPFVFKCKNISCEKNAKCSNIKSKIIKILCILLIFCCFVIILLNPTRFVESAKKGIFLWGNNVLPALFPFMFLTKLLIELLPKRLCKPNVYVFCLSVLSGYPISAKLLSECYERGVMNSRQVKRVYSYSSTSGPVFVIGTVGALFFKSALVGVIIFVLHILSSLLTGVLFGGFKKEKYGEVGARDESDNRDLISSSVVNSISSILMVGAFIMLFYVLFDVVCVTQVVNLCCEVLAKLGLNEMIGFGFVSGLFEFTRGVFELGQIGEKLCVCLAGFLVSFSGLCVMLQNYAFLSKAKVSFGYIFGVKLVHGVLTFAGLWLVL